MSNTIVKVENISKQYRLGEIGTGSLAHDVNRWWYKVRGKDDPYLKIGETNDRTKNSTSEYVWSLKDISFDIQQGDAVGIIGRNGAGKSTLLKVLSRVTAPTTGSVKVKGRIASLLEVGTGFHPDLSGRDNIFLNGAILGMRKAEIKRKFDEIVSFAGVERYVDTPVKRYSSGMYVRLAFAVAAHLESEILIVDEVLAVGDIEFQKKCLGKMNDVSKGEGRTVLFVSHNMGSIAQLCNTGILLKNGTTSFSGDIKTCINKYMDMQENLSVYHQKTPKQANYIKSVEFHSIDGAALGTFTFEQRIFIEVKLAFVENVPDLNLSIVFRDNQERPLFATHQLIVNQSGERTYTAEIPGKFLVPNNYYVECVLHIPNIQVVDSLKTPLTFTIEDSGGAHSSYNSADLGSIIPPVNWSF